MEKRTKIVCTLGPATDNDEILKAMIRSGMNVARMNFSHGSHAEHKERMDRVKRIRKELDIPVGILLDTKGPEIRTGKFKGDSVELKEGQTFVLTPEDILGDETKASITYKDLYRDVSIGTNILIDDGLVSLVVDKIEDKKVICRVMNEGTVKNNKSINIPGITIRMPYISKKDEEDIIFGIENDVDFIALSFVRSIDDVLDVKKILEKNNGTDIRLIAKIENQDGVDNFNEIVLVSDGAMVARGDMGVEIPIEEIPAIQKNLIKECRLAGKTVITATQMLDSMIRNPRPTRAEATDVANAIYDGTSATMLSGETAVGKYPVESVQTMAKIARRTEASIDYKSRFLKDGEKYNGTVSVTNSISQAACMTAHSLDAAAIITVTQTGNTARMISRFRPACPIIATTSSEKSCRQLALEWGVDPFIIGNKETTDEIFHEASETAVRRGLVKSGDIVVLSAGLPMAMSGATNIIKVQIVGDVLVKGERVNQLSVTGNACVCRSLSDLKHYFEPGDIIVVPETTNEMLPFIKKAKGIISEKGGMTSHAAIIGLTLDIPVVCGAECATEILKSGTMVTIDSSRGIVFSGSHEEN